MHGENPRGWSTGDLQTVEEETAAEDHRQLVRQLHLVKQRHVERPRPAAHHWNNTREENGRHTGENPRLNHT